MIAANEAMQARRRRARGAWFGLWTMRDAFRRPFEFGEVFRPIFELGHLRGFRQSRFGGDNALVLNLEYRREISPYFDLIAFGDAGKVFARAGDLGFAGLEGAASSGGTVEIPRSGLIRVRFGVEQGRDEALAAGVARVPSRNEIHARSNQSSESLLAGPDQEKNSRPFQAFNPADYMPSGLCFWATDVLPRLPA